MNVLNSFSRRLGLLVSGLVAATLLSGCALGDMSLSGAPSDPNATGHVDLHGKAIGGNLPIRFATIDMYAVSNTGYGNASHLLTTVLDGTTGSKFYYPGGTTGCDQTGLTPTAYLIDGSGNATFTATNSMIGGQLISISDASGSGAAGTYLVTSATGATFTVSTSLGAGAGTTSGTFTPVCYTHPTTDQTGSFAITNDYACGGFGSSVVYIQNTGGNPGLSSITDVNSSLVLTALLQTNATTPTALTCSNLSSANYVNINELTTAAMGLAMGQFFTTTYGGSPSADGFGTSSTNGLGMTNAANTAMQLVSSANGTANVAYNLTSGSFSVTVTPETTKVQTIGNILATCVNGETNNTQCASLFGALSTGTTPTDTLQAAALIGINPTAGGPTGNLALWNLAQATGAPFGSGLGAQPADWSVAIQYTDTNSGCTTGDTGTCVLYFPQEVLTDPSGNLFVLNHNTTGPIDSLTELSANGTPITNIDSIAGVNFNTNNTRNMAIDINGNVWLTASSTAQILEYVPTGGSHGIGPTSQPYAIAIDGGNNVFVGHASSSSTYNVSEFSGSALASPVTTTPNATDQIEFPELCSTSTILYTTCTSQTGTNLFLPEFAAVDTNGNVWMTGGSNSPAGSVLLMSGYSSTGTTFPRKQGSGTDTVTAGYSILAGGTGGIPGFSSPYGAAAGPGGVMWFANFGSGAHGLVEMTSTTAGTVFGSSNADASPRYPAVDGNGNVWLTNSSMGSVSEFQGTTANGGVVGTVLSPLKTGTAPYTVPGFTHTSISTPYGVSIDVAGNVWVANNVATTGGITELVGIGAPTINPIAKSLPSAVGTRP